MTDTGSARRPLASCDKCEVLPAPLQQGTLFIAPPPGHALTKMQGLFSRMGLATVPAPRGVLGVVLGEGAARRVAVDLSGALSRLELADGKCLLLPEGVEPSLEDLLRFESLQTFVARSSGDWVVEILRDGRIEAHGADLAQGFLCARPAASPPKPFHGTAVPSPRSGDL